MHNYPDLITYDFEHVLQYSIGKEAYIYHRITSLSKDVENYVEQFIHSCEHSAVLVGHNSIGQKINLHTHRFSDSKKLTMTVIIRLTFEDTPVQYSFYEPISEQDPMLDKYYTNPKMLEIYARKHEKHTFETKARSSVLVFNAAQTPHSVTYSNDLYLYFVYDNVIFKDGMLDQVQAQSEQTFFDNLSAEERLYFWNL
jgi:hypothetical protein